MTTKRLRDSMFFSLRMASEEELFNASFEETVKLFKMFNLEKDVITGLIHQLKEEYKNVIYEEIKNET